MKHLIYAALMGVLFAFQSPGSAQAATPQDYLKRGEYDAARSSLAKLVANDPNGPVHQAYLEGQILLRKNQPAAAIELFRDLVRIAPAYEPARRELTLLLAHRGDVTAARYHAERLVAETADEQLRAGLQTYILNNTSRKPSGFALRFALLPSSNQTRGSAEQEILVGGVPFTLNPSSRASSGVGLSIGGTAWRRWQWSETWSGVGSASLDAKFYDSALNTETTAIVRFDVIRGGQRGRFSFGPITELSFSDSDIVRRRWGAEVRGAYQLRPRDVVSGALRFDRQTYDQSPFRDGHRMRASASYQHRVTPTLGLSFGVSHLRETTQRAHLDHRETGVSVGVDKQWKSGLSTGVVLAFEHDRYDGIFPGTVTPREDDTTSVTFTVQHNKVQIGKYVPRITYTYTRAKSNVALFDYDSHDIGASLSMKF
ncbi:hypothetical protein LCGC14_0174060 [marine sediment metagenome]|uniref:DUF560 domain-containing protein n=2 Tax=root TaxID=1 RepID=A0A7V1A8H5_9RHOB|nr:surface lipoprotein assembly modifier [Sulfitobacter litoralis]HDY96338.1 DUF560 domain-containing protein [Sulfitobacter litoralis]HDZ52354.1 DUF560 domain-containing protein [Sulfitobacter litoralis]|tara:strand:+ start:504 stop:1784 length:1281 start_codon:yes stop_codon:yes gene_type:complete